MHTAEPDCDEYPAAHCPHVEDDDAAVALLAVPAEHEMQDVIDVLPLFGL